MGQTTQGYPYPEGTDRVADGDNAIKALAEAVDLRLGIVVCGFATITFPNAASVNLVVNFPAGAFIAPPRAVIIQPKDSTVFVTGVSSISATQFTAMFRHYQNAVNSYVCNFSWIAHS